MYCVTSKIITRSQTKYVNATNSSPVISPAKIYLPNQVLTPYQNTNYFGSYIAVSADNTSLAIGSQSKNGIRGNTQIYSKNSDSNWNITPDITIPGSVLSLEFSPDSETLAIVNTSTNLYKKDYNGDWCNNAVATLHGIYNKIKFSPDGSSIATIQAVIGYKGGVIQLFSQDDWGSWNTSPTQLLTSSGNWVFGTDLAFNSESNKLAVGIQGTSNGLIADAGNVHIYSRQENLTSWNLTPNITLRSSSPGAIGEFGYSIAFSPFGNYLAIGEPHGGTKQQGLVSLFNLDLNERWLKNPTAILKSNNPGPYDRFGYSIAFSPDNKLLAIGDIGGELPNKIKDSGTVQVFSQSNTVTAFAKPKVILVSKKPKPNSYFGRSIAFTTDCKQLIIGESFRELQYKTQSGAVNIFNTDNFK